MDISAVYRGGGQKRHLSRKEIENMKKNMKKVPIIQLKGDIYHKKEDEEANKLLEKIDDNK